MSGVLASNSLQCWRRTARLLVVVDVAVAQCELRRGPTEEAHWPALLSARGQQRPHVEAQLQNLLCRFTIAITVAKTLPLFRSRYLPHSLLLSSKTRSTRTLTTATRATTRPHGHFESVSPRSQVLLRREHTGTCVTLRAGTGSGVDQLQGTSFVSTPPTTLYERLTPTTSWYGTSLVTGGHRKDILKAGVLHIQAGDRVDIRHGLRA